MAAPAAASAHQVIGPGRSGSARMSATMTPSIKNGTASNRGPRAPPAPPEAAAAACRWGADHRASWSVRSERGPAFGQAGSGDPSSGVPQHRTEHGPFRLESHLSHPRNLRGAAARGDMVCSPLKPQPTGGLFVWRSGRRRLAASSGAATRGGWAFFPGAMRLLARQQSRRRRLTPWRVRRRSAPAS